VEALHALLVTKGRVTSEGYLKQWKRYNDVTRGPAKTSAERVRKHREKKKKEEKQESLNLDGSCNDCNESNDVTTQYNTLQDITVRDSSLPPHPPEKSKGEFLNKSKSMSEEGEKKAFDILREIDELDISVAMAEAPGWDHRVLVQHFNANVAAGKFQIPRKPVKAFIGFCREFTKGKRP
jgi:hypothetical protein